MKYRYLTYAIDKHQSSPVFRNDIPDSLRENCDDGYDVVVDLETGQRYYSGEWMTVDTAPPPQVLRGEGEDFRSDAVALARLVNLPEGSGSLGAYFPAATYLEMRRLARKLAGEPA